MSLQDPIADLLTQIRNGQMVQKAKIILSDSKRKVAILKVLHEEGYIGEFHQVKDEDGHPKLVVHLKYHNQEPVIEKIRRISRPGLRIYKKKDELPIVMGGLGIAVISTPQGVMSDKQARKLGQGGEVLCLVA